MICYAIHSCVEFVIVGFCDRSGEVLQLDSQKFSQYHRLPHSCSFNSRMFFLRSEQCNCLGISLFHFLSFFIEVNRQTDRHTGRESKLMTDRGGQEASNTGAMIKTLLDFSVISSCSSLTTDQFL